MAVVLRPLPATRVANLTPAGCLLAFATLILIAPEPIGAWWLVAAAAAIALAVYLAIRAWRYSVTLDFERAVVRGLFWGRVVPLSQVSAVTDLGWMLWTSESGATRRTPLTLFWTPGIALERYKRHAHEGLERTKNWTRRH